MGPVPVAVEVATDVPMTVDVAPVELASGVKQVIPPLTDPLSTLTSSVHPPLQQGFGVQVKPGPGVPLSGVPFPPWGCRIHPDGPPHPLFFGLDGFFPYGLGLIGLVYVPSARHEGPVVDEVVVTGGFLGGYFHPWCQPSFDELEELQELLLDELLEDFLDDLE